MSFEFNPGQFRQAARSRELIRFRADVAESPGDLDQAKDDELRAPLLGFAVAVPISALLWFGLYMIGNFLIQAVNP